MKMRKLMALLCAFTLAVSASSVTYAVETNWPSPEEDLIKLNGGKDSDTDYTHFADEEAAAEDAGSTTTSTTAAASAGGAATTTAATATAAAPAAGGSGAAASAAAGGSGSGAAASKQAPAGAVKAEVDASKTDVSVPNGILIVKAESAKYAADSVCGKFVYAMNEDSATHTSPEIISEILGLDGTGASFQTTALMLIDAKTFELIPAGKITFTMPGNQLTQGLTSEQMKAFGAGLDTNKGFAEGVTANANGTLTVTLNEGGPFAVAKLG